MENIDFSPSACAVDHSLPCRDTVHIAFYVVVELVQNVSFSCVSIASLHSILLLFYSCAQYVDEEVNNNYNVAE